MPGSSTIAPAAHVFVLCYLFLLQSLYTQLVQQQDKLEDITDQTAGSGLSTAVIAPVLTLYSKKGLLTPAQVNSSKTAASFVTTGLTHPTLGFMWFKPDPQSSSFIDNSHPDVALNSWGVWVLNATAPAAAKSNNTVSGCCSLCWVLLYLVTHNCGYPCCILNTPGTLGMYSLRPFVICILCGTQFQFGNRARICPHTHILTCS